MTDTIVDKLLLQAIETNKIKIDKYREQVNQLVTTLDILTKENKEYLNKYQELCPHTDIKREQTGYIAGGYDHVSQTTYTDKCTRCGKVVGSKNVRGTYA